MKEKREGKGERGLWLVWLGGLVLLWGQASCVPGQASLRQEKRAPARAESEGKGDRQRGRQEAGKSVVARCLGASRLVSQRADCIEPHLTQGAEAQRRRHLAELLESSYGGRAVILRFLRQNNVRLRSFLALKILEQVHQSRVSPSSLGKYYDAARQDFLEAMARLPLDKKIHAAQQLVQAQRFLTFGQIYQEFHLYLKIPARRLWQMIRQETVLKTAMSLVLLLPCSQGNTSFPADYTKAMKALNLYYTTWRAWDIYVEASGARKLMKALRAWKQGRRVPPPRVNKEAVRRAVLLARVLRRLQPKTKGFIKRVRQRPHRNRMLSWFQWMVLRGPRSATSRPTRRPRPARRRPPGEIRL